MIHEVSNFGTGALSWENADEKRKLLANRKIEDQNRARMSELFKHYDDSHPLNVYLAPETKQEFRTGQYIPTTAQVWVRMADVGDPEKLKTALRIPIHHALGGANPAAGGGMDQPGDLKRTMIYGIRSCVAAQPGRRFHDPLEEAEASVKISGSADLQKKAMGLIHAYLLAQEGLFAYSTEEILYAPVTSGPQASGKPLYEMFLSQANLFFKKKTAAMQHRTKSSTSASASMWPRKTRGKRSPGRSTMTIPSRFRSLIPTRKRSTLS